MRRGVTLVELVVTMVVFGIVLGLVTQTVLFHERLQRRLQSASAASRAAHQATAILATVLADASAIDLVAGRSSDSAIEVMAQVGAGVACISGDELRTATRSATADPPLVSFATMPRPGDRLLVFDARSKPPRWRARTVVDQVPTATQPCAAAGVPSASALALLFDSTLDAPPVAVFRLLRRTRYNLYRGGDHRWYLGMREWNAQAQAFNGVQPVAGPLHAYSARAERTGLRFEYFDSTGGRVDVSAGSTAVSRVAITVRPADSTVEAARRSVALRRAP